MDWKEQYTVYQNQSTQIDLCLRAVFSFNIYILGNKHSFEGADLLGALKETFEHRNTSMDTIVAFETGFADDAIRKSRWKSFAKKKKISLDVSLQETIDFIEKFLNPLAEAMRENKDFDLQWNPEKKEWE